jgi:hypothetical protein
MARERCDLGSSKSANAKLHIWMQTNGKTDEAEAEAKTKESHAKKTNLTKA